MVKLNIFSSSASPAATTPSSEHRIKQNGANKFGGGKPMTPMPNKSRQNNQNKWKAQSEPRKPFQRQPQQRQSPASATKSILKMPNGSAKAIPATDGQQPRKQFGQKRRVSFGSESNDSAVKQQKMLRMELSGEDETPKIGQQHKFRQQKMNGGNESSKNNNTPKKTFGLPMQSPKNVAMSNGAATTTTAAVPTAPMAVAALPKPRQQQQQKKQKQQHQQAIPKTDTEQQQPKDGGQVTKREKKQLQKKKRNEKSQAHKKQLQEQKKEQPSNRNTSQKPEKNNRQKSIRQAVERMQNAVKMMQKQQTKKEGDTDSEGEQKQQEDKNGSKKDETLFNSVASSLENLLPVRFAFGRLRTANRRESAELCKHIVHFGALLEPKKFKPFAQLLLNKKDDDDKTAVVNGKTEEQTGAATREAAEEEEDEQRVLARSLCVLSAALCLMGHALPAAGDTAQRRDEYLKESMELRKMAKNLLGADAQQLTATIDAITPVLVDLVLAWSSRQAWTHRALGAFALCRFAKRLNCAHFEPLLKAIVETDAELLKEEEADDDEDKEENEEDDANEEEEEESMDDDDEEEETAEVNPKLVADVRRALGKAALPKNASDVPSDDDNWVGVADRLMQGRIQTNHWFLELNDDQMFRLDHDLARAFRKHSSKRSELARQASIFRFRLIELVSAYLSTAPFSEALSLSVHIMSSTIWHANDIHKKLAVQVVDPLMQRKKENTTPAKRIAKQFKQLLDGATANDVDNEQQKQRRQRVGAKRDAATAVVRGALMLFSLAADHTEHKGAPELLRLVEQQVLNGYFASEENTYKSLLQSSLLNRLCAAYPQYLGAKFLPALLAFTIDNKVAENKKHQAFNLAHILLSRKDSPKFYATVSDDIGTYLVRAVPLFFKKSPSPNTDVKNHMLAKFVFMLGWFLNADGVSEISTNAIKQSIASVDIGSLNEQKLAELLGNDGMKELRRFLKLRGTVQQFGGDKTMANRFIATLGKKLEEGTPEGEEDDDVEEEEDDEGSDDEMEDEDEEGMDDEEEDDDE